MRTARVAHTSRVAHTARSARSAHAARVKPPPLPPQTQTLDAVWGGAILGARPPSLYPLFSASRAACTILSHFCAILEISPIGQNSHLTKFPIYIYLLYIHMHRHLVEKSQRL